MLLLALVLVISGAAAAASPPPPAIVPHGCFVDDRANRQMRFCPTQATPSACAAQGIVPTLTREWCESGCGEIGKSLAGVEAGHACFCDDELATPSAAAPQAECDDPCIANASETCGGNLRMQVWQVPKGPYPPAPPRPAPPSPRPPPPPPPAPWPVPDLRLRPIFHLPTIKQPGYTGDANGMMFRRVPWNSKVDTNGLFHLFWQCVLKRGAGLWWCHATSEDYVTWKSQPPAFGPGAESGGAAQLDDGNVVTIFNRIPGGHWAASPTEPRTDPYLKNWSFTAPVAGISGTDLNGAFKDGSGDGFWRIVSDAHEFGGGAGGANMYRNMDGNLTKWAPEGDGTLHRWKWARCVDNQKECGGHPYPCDPSMFRIPNSDVWVVYGMQKTCGYSGREFYALGTYNTASVNHSFTLINNISDMGNNLWDGGDGYASMTVYDPIKDHRIWHSAVIEGDRDPSDPHNGFMNDWVGEKGWFGVLSLPRVVQIGNTSLDDGSYDLHLVTPPLPELAALRLPSKRNSDGRMLTNALLPPLYGPAVSDKEARSGVATATAGGADAPTVLPLRGTSVEINASFALPPADADGSGWDVGLQLLWSDSNEEYTKVGVKDGSFLEGVDLWDEVNGDSAQTTVASANACRAACVATNTAHGGAGPACGAWTFNSVTNNCRFKAYAQRCVLVPNAAPCFLPNYAGSNATVSTSGFIHQRNVRFAALYVERSKSWITNTSCNWGGITGDCNYGHFDFAQVLRLLPTDEDLNVHAFADKSIIEVFGQRGRAVVTARVYPTLPNSTKIGVYNGGTHGSVAATVAAWALGSASISTSGHY